MADKSELLLKALEKRVSDLERILERLEKDLDKDRTKKMYEDELNRRNEEMKRAKMIGDLNLDARFRFIETKLAELDGRRKPG